MVQLSINKAVLPDKGQGLMKRQIDLEKALENEEAILKKMVVETEGNTG